MPAKTITLRKKRYRTKRAKRKLARYLLRRATKHKLFSPEQLYALRTLIEENLLIEEETREHLYIPVLYAENVSRGVWIPQLTLAA